MINLKNTIIALKKIQGFKIRGIRVVLLTWLIFTSILFVFYSVPRTESGTVTGVMFKVVNLYDEVGMNEVGKTIEIRITVLESNGNLNISIGIVNGTSYYFTRMNAGDSIRIVIKQTSVDNIATGFVIACDSVFKVNYIIKSTGISERLLFPLILLFLFLILDIISEALLEKRKTSLNKEISDFDFNQKNRRSNFFKRTYLVFSYYFNGLNWNGAAIFNLIFGILALILGIISGSLYYTDHIFGIYEKERGYFPYILTGHKLLPDGRLISIYKYSLIKDVTLLTFTYEKGFFSLQGMQSIFPSKIYFGILFLILFLPILKHENKNTISHYKTLPIRSHEDILGKILAMTIAIYFWIGIEFILTLLNNMLIGKIHVSLKAIIISILIAFFYVILEVSAYVSLLMISKKQSVQYLVIGILWILILFAPLIGFNIELPIFSKIYPELDKRQQLIYDFKDLITYWVIWELIVSLIISYSLVLWDQNARNTFYYKLQKLVKKQNFL